MPYPLYSKIKINDGGDPDCDIDKDVVRRLDADGTETKIVRTVYSGRARAKLTRFEFEQDFDCGPEILCGDPCDRKSWDDVFVGFKAAVDKLAA